MTWLGIITFLIVPCDTLPTVSQSALISDAVLVDASACRLNVIAHCQRVELRSDLALLWDCESDRFLLDGFE